MKKIYITLLVALFALGACTKQKEINPQDFLVEARYDGMKGEIDSVVVTHYKDIEGAKSDKIILIASATYDKNGYVTENISKSFDGEGKILGNNIYKVLRADNSLITSYSVEQLGTDVVSFKLDKREDNKEIYSLNCPDGKDNPLTIKTFEKLVVITEMDYGKYKTHITNTFSEEGKSIKSVTINNNSTQTSEIEYDSKGMISKKTLQESEGSAPVISIYTNYEFDEKEPQNWISRQRQDAEGNVEAYEVRKIYYRK